MTKKIMFNSILIIFMLVLLFFLFYKLTLINVYILGGALPGEARLRAVLPGAFWCRIAIKTVQLPRGSLLPKPKLRVRPRPRPRAEVQPKARASRPTEKIHQSLRRLLCILFYIYIYIYIYTSDSK